MEVSGNDNVRLLFKKLFHRSYELQFLLKNHNAQVLFWEITEFFGWLLLETCLVGSSQTSIIFWRITGTTWKHVNMKSDISWIIAKHAWNDILQIQVNFWCSIYCARTLLRMILWQPQEGLNCEPLVFYAVT